MEFVHNPIYNTLTHDLLRIESDEDNMHVLTSHRPNISYYCPEEDRPDCYKNQRLRDVYGLEDFTSGGDEVTYFDGNHYYDQTPTPSGLTEGPWGHTMQPRYYKKDKHAVHRLFELDSGVDEQYTKPSHVYEVENGTRGGSTKVTKVKKFDEFTVSPTSRERAYPGWPEKAGFRSVSYSERDDIGLLDRDNEFSDYFGPDYINTDYGLARSEGGVGDERKRYLQLQYGVADDMILREGGKEEEIYGHGNSVERMIPGYGKPLMYHAFDEYAHLPQLDVMGRFYIPPRNYFEEQIPRLDHKEPVYADSKYVVNNYYDVNLV